MNLSGRVSKPFAQSRRIIITKGMAGTVVVTRTSHVSRLSCKRWFCLVYVSESFDQSRRTTIRKAHGGNRGGHKNISKLPQTRTFHLIRVSESFDSCLVISLSSYGGALPGGIKCCAIFHPNPCIPNALKIKSSSYPDPHHLINPSRFAPLPLTTRLHRHLLPPSASQIHHESCSV